MPLITISGQTGAGKTALVNALADRWNNVLIRHWNLPPPVSAYKEILNADVMTLRTDPNKLIIYESNWSRALLHHAINIMPDQGSPFHAEWNYGRVVDALGLRIMLHTNAPLVSVSGELEKLWYFRHARTYRYLSLTNDYTEENLQANADLVFSTLASRPFIYFPPIFCGNPESRIILINSREDARVGKSPLKRTPMAFDLPLTAHNDGAWVQAMGPKLMEFAYAESRGVPLNIIRKFSTVVPLTSDAEQWCRTHVQHHHIVRVKGPYECRKIENNKHGDIKTLKQQQIELEEARKQIGELK